MIPYRNTRNGERSRFLHMGRLDERLHRVDIEPKRPFVRGFPRPQLHGGMKMTFWTKIKDFFFGVALIKVDTAMEVVQRMDADRDGCINVRELVTWLMRLKE